MDDTLARGWSAPFDYHFVWRGLLMAVLLGVAGGLVGCVLLLRRMVLMADSFGHSLLPGVALAYLVMGPGTPALLAGALVAGLLTSLMSSVVSRLTRLKEEAAFGSLFVLCFAGGVALMSRIAAPVDLLHLLFGNILGVTGADLWLVWSTTAITVLTLCLGYRALVVDLFDPAFLALSGYSSRWTHGVILAVVVLNLVAALQAVGMVLALGLFILPAVIAYLWCDRVGTMLITAAACGGLLAGLGLLVSYYADLPSGACMVGVLGMGFIVSLVTSPRHGLWGAWQTSALRARAMDGRESAGRP